MRALGLLSRAGLRHAVGQGNHNRCGWLALRPVCGLPAQQQRQQQLETAAAQACAAASGSSSSNTSSVDAKPYPRKAYQHSNHYSCPACGQQCHRVAVLQRHVLKCCPDAVGMEEWEAAATDELALQAILSTIAAREERQRQRVLELTFRQRDSSGEPIRQELDVVAVAMGLPLARAERLLQRAMRAVPLAADPHPVEVIYEDADLLAVNKPPGVISAPKHRYVGGSIVNRIIGTLGFEPLVLHRLDMNTSGVLLFAKTREVVPGIHAQFRNKEARKEYYALSIGTPAEGRFTVDAAIDRDEREAIARRVAPTGKPAVTRFQVVSCSPGAELCAGQPAALVADPQSLPRMGASLVRCEPLTGRTHQIRVHLAHVGHPLVGDDVYGLVGPWILRHALHAAALTVRHPRSGAALRIEAPLPEDMRAAMRLLGLRQP